MNSNHIIWHDLAQIFLPMIAFVILGVRKAKAVKASEVNREQAVLSSRVWPGDVLKAANNIAHQFEIPVLRSIILVKNIIFVKAVLVLLASLLNNALLQKKNHKLSFKGTQTTC
jgi:hypothetical protein